MIQKDKLYHLIGGALALAMSAALLWVMRHAGVPVATALAGVALGVGLEAYQWVRKEGEPDAEDAIYTAAPWWAAALAMHLMGVT